MIRQLKDRILRSVYTSIYRPGHYYSTIPSMDELANDWERLFGKDDQLDDIDLNKPEQEKLLKAFVDYHSEIDFPSEPTKEYRYYSGNTFFNKGDAMTLYSMIREYNPQKVIEIGSGFSSCVCLDVNERFFDNSIELSFIEPYPERLNSLLRDDDKKRVVQISKRVQDVELSFFDQLNASDILFVDSSHVSKIGSDLNYILFKILPLLKKGVVIHFHDVCFPFEYPSSWIKNGVFWNEAYLLRAFLMNNSDYKILMWCNFVDSHYSEILKERLPKFNPTGGSFWLEKMN